MRSNIEGRRIKTMITYKIEIRRYKELTYILRSSSTTIVRRTYVGTVRYVRRYGGTVGNRNGTYVPERNRYVTVGYGTGYRPGTRSSRFPFPFSGLR